MASRHGRAVSRRVRATSRLVRAPIRESGNPSALRQLRGGVEVREAAADRAAVAGLHVSDMVQCLGEQGAARRHQGARSPLCRSGGSWHRSPARRRPRRSRQARARGSDPPRSPVSRSGSSSSASATGRQPAASHPRPGRGRRSPRPPSSGGDRRRAPASRVADVRRQHLLLQRLGNSSNHEARHFGQDTGAAPVLLGLASEDGVRHHIHPRAPRNVGEQGPRLGRRHRQLEAVLDDHVDGETSRVRPAGRVVDMAGAHPQDQRYRTRLRPSHPRVQMIESRRTCPEPYPM